MTVYVDDMYKNLLGRYGRMKMSHMIADTEDELHEMAARIGVARNWHQGDHYDICITMRKRALAHGAVAITLRELAILSSRQNSNAGRGILLEHILLDIRKEPAKRNPEIAIRGDEDWID
jgi:hypothetical protein